MKLYTEEQVRKAMYMKSDIKYVTYTDDNIVDSLTPIELPTDEEIEKRADYYSFFEDSSAYVDFKQGAKWMRDKIQGGNQ